MRNNYAVLALCGDYMDADQINSSTITDSVDEQIAQMIEDAYFGNEETYHKDLLATHMTDHFMRFCLKVSALENELYYILTQDLGIIEDDQNRFADWLEDGNCVYVQHIYVSNDADEDKEANRAKAESVRQQLLSGIDISELIGTSANEDLQNVIPYFVVRGVYTEALENAAFSLTEDGNVSEVIDTGDG